VHIDGRGFVDVRRILPVYLFEVIALTTVVRSATVGDVIWTVVVFAFTGWEWTFVSGFHSWNERLRVELSSLKRECGGLLEYVTNGN
jgi:hypothetical protein